MFVYWKKFGFFQCADHRSNKKLYPNICLYLWASFWLFNPAYNKLDKPCYSKGSNMVPKGDRW